MMGRLNEIGLGVYQTNYSNVPDSTCITPEQMVQHWSGFLGPRCGQLA